MPQVGAGLSLQGPSGLGPEALGSPALTLHTFPVPAAARAGGQVRRVHGDASRGAGGAQEPPQQDRAQHHIPALPLARAVPHGERPLWVPASHLLGRRAPRQRGRSRGEVQRVGSSFHCLDQISIWGSRARSRQTHSSSAVSLTRSFFFFPCVHNGYISWEPQLSGRSYSYLVIFLTVLEYELFWAHSSFQIS